MQVSPATSVSAAVSSPSSPPPAPQSGTVGSHGSFWLPGDAEVLRGRTVPDRQGQSTKGHGQGKGEPGRATTDVRQAMRGGKSANSSPTESKTARSNASSTQGRQQAAAKLAGARTALPITKPISGKALSESDRSASRSAENFAASTPAKSRTQGREPLLAAKPERFVHPDHQGDTNNGRRRGTKHAREAGELENHSRKSKTEVKEQIFETTIAGKTTGRSASLLVGSETSKTMLPENLRPVLPVLVARVALLSREGRRVARFAIDLPGGAKLGVKIELSEKKVRIAFVTADSDLRSALQSGEGPIGEVLGELGFGCGELFVASSYRELGESLPKAA